MQILIVDDEPAIAEMLAYALRAEGYQTDWCDIGGGALEKTRQENYALILLDVGLPDMSGFDVCRQLRRFSEVPVIFLTARAEEIDRIVGLELGADDYVAKPFSPREMVSRVRAVLRRTQAGNIKSNETASATSAARWFDVDQEGLRIRYFGLPLSLTRYEYRLLALLLERSGRVLSRAHLMEAAWFDAEESLERTVDAHIKTLRAKLKAVRPELDPIETHRGLGYSIRNEVQ